MNNNSRKIRIITIIMLLSLVTTLFSACATTTVTTADYFTAEMPTVESIVGYNVESTTTETESIDSVVKLSTTNSDGASVWGGNTDTDITWYTEHTADDKYTISTADQLAGLASLVNNTAGQGATVTFSGKTITLASNIVLNSGYTFEFDADTGLIEIGYDSDGEGGSEAAIVAYQGTGIAGTTSFTGTDKDVSKAGAYYNASTTADGNITASTIGLNSWTAIGWYDYTEYKIYSFQGTFDGGGNTISGLYINTSSYYQGLFGYSTGTVENLNVSGSVTSTNTSAGYIGGVVGYNYKGTVSNCTFDGTVSGKYVGGIVGMNSGGTIKNCTSSATVTTSAYYAGGIVGNSTNSGSKISNCTFTGEVYGGGTIGGIAGQNGSYSIITNCVNEGTISGTSSVGGIASSVGGIVGISQGSGATVKNCYNTGNVTGTDSGIGGVVGNIVSGAVYNCYNTGNVTGDSNVGGVVGSNNGTVSNCYAFSGISVTGNDGDNSSVTAGSVILIGKNSKDTTQYNAIFADGGVLTWADDSKYSDSDEDECKTLLSALNAYVDADNGTNNLSSWVSAAGENVGDAFAVFPVATLVDGYGGEVAILGDGSAVYTYGEVSYTTALADDITVGDITISKDHINSLLAKWQAITDGGSGMIYVDGKELTDNSTYTTTLSAGNYYIAEDIIELDNLIKISGEVVNLALAGNVIDGNGYEGDKIIAISIENGSTLNLYGNGATIGYGTGVGADYSYKLGDTYAGTGYTAITGGLITGGTKGVEVNSGTLNMYGTTIAGNSSSGVFAYNGASVYIENATISGNASTTYGGGVHIQNATNVTIKNSTISNNSAENGGGVYIASTETAKLSGNTISGNSAENGGGVYIDATATATETATLSGNTISGNTATTYGGGVYIDATATATETATLSGNTISGNSAENGGGVYNDGTLEMNGDEISGNTATENGGGVYNVGTLTMKGDEISGNTAIELGGGVYNVGTSLTMNGGKISGNSTTARGGGVYNGGGFFVSGTVVISGNSVGTWSGDVFTASAANNVYLSADRTIAVQTLSVDDTDSENPIAPSIGVTMQDTMGQLTGTATEADVEYFFSDDSGYEVSFDTDNSCIMLSEVVVPTTSSSSSGISLDISAPTIALDGEIVTIYDKNLVSITINGKEVEITDSTMIIDLSEYGNGEHEIVATDKYKRATTETVTVSSVEEEAEAPEATPAPTPTETPTATVAPTVDTNPTTNGGYAVWIILGVIALGAVGFVIYKKKK
ncbi:MAG: right-handed parallel beta-helix repeat-containing protein [Bacillota bacterium]